jgi:D-sedoheptulose 7-phosphate isomerase
MDTIERIARHFQASADLTRDLGELLSPAIAAAAMTIVQALMEDRKVLVCGQDGSAVLAAYIADCLLGCHERERPGLAVIALDGERQGLSPCRHGPDSDQRFARPLLALGQQGDVLLALCSSGNEPPMLGAIRAAHEREIRIIALTGADGGKLLELLHPDDIHIGVPHHSNSRVQEVYLLTLHCLCDAIDSHLLGVE